MSVRHPIISVTGSSGAGTSSVKKTFERIFNREGVKAARRLEIVARRILTLIHSTSNGPEGILEHCATQAGWPLA